MKKESRKKGLRGCCPLVVAFKTQIIIISIMSRLFAVVAVACLFAFAVLGADANDSDKQRVLCSACEATMKEIWKKLSKIGGRRKTETNVIEAFDGICEDMDSRIFQFSTLIYRITHFFRF